MKNKIIAVIFSAIVIVSFLSFMGYIFLFSNSGCTTSGLTQTNNGVILDQDLNFLDKGVHSNVRLGFLL